MNEKNIDELTVQGFGDEWSRLDQSQLSDSERNEIFSTYFSIFPWGKLSHDSVGFDVGCGSGRWAQIVAPRVGTLHCIDPSDALVVAKNNLRDIPNCQFHLADANSLPFPDASMDFGYSLGVLHHVPDTQSALSHCVQKLRPGAPFLIYLYYAFDYRPKWYRFIWLLSDIARRFISRLPLWLRYHLSQSIALIVYWPLSRLAKAVEFLGFGVNHFPLSAYRHLSFYTMRTDALDRFGTRLEKRFSKIEVYNLMKRSGLENIVFSESVPFWCAVGTRKIDN